MVGVKHRGSPSIPTTALHRNVYRIKNVEIWKSARERSYPVGNRPHPLKSRHSPAFDAPCQPTLGGFPDRVHQLPAFPNTRLPFGLVWSLGLVFE